MKIQVLLLAAAIALSEGIISQRPQCPRPDNCGPRIIAKCPYRNPPADCPTCCCEATKNVEFYNPHRPEPRCTAPPSVYTVKFVSTWSGVCHPEYYPPTARWSPPTGASHNTEYQMWDACMDNGTVSPGVALVSQLGLPTVIIQEYGAAGDNILDTFVADLVIGPGETSRDLNVDKEHQWVSVITMHVPSRDQLVGVADLRLCNGHDWKRRVKVCAELFSTATKSERFHEPMERNSIQWNNCSFGYFEFTFKEYNDSSQEVPKDCAFESHGVCPPSEYIPKKCRTCCCLPSDNVEFYHPDGPNTVCGASESATYKVSLISQYGSTCHPDFPVPADFGTPFFTGLLITSHGAVTGYDKCLNHIGDGLLHYLKYIDSNTEEVLEGATTAATYALAENIYYDIYITDASRILGNRKRKTGYINVNPNNSYSTVESKLVPSYNQFLGISSLNLCDGSGWRDKVEVCGELLAAVNRTETPDAESVVQGNQCSFGTFVFERIRTGPQPSPEPPCFPLSGDDLEELDISACCNFDFVIEGKPILDFFPSSHGNLVHRYMVKVEAVLYDDIDHVQVDDLVEIYTCSIPARLGQLRPRKTYIFAGHRDCASNALVIDSQGYLDTLQRGRREAELRCVSHIKNGGCDDERT